MSKTIANTLAISAAAAIALIATTVPSQAAFNGQCKFIPASATANSVNAAKAAWQQKVQSNFGSKWAIWIGAKNPSIISIGGGQFRASARPCYYEPVL